MICNTLIVLRGQDVIWAPFSAGQRWKNSKKQENFVQLPTITHDDCPEASTSGFLVALDPLHWAMHLVLYRRITMASKMACNKSTFFVFFICMWLCCSPRQQDVSTCPMMASSGFKWSSGPPPSGDVCNILLVRQFGYQNRSHQTPVLPYVGFHTTVFKLIDFLNFFGGKILEKPTFWTECFLCFIFLELPMSPLRPILLTFFW